MFLAVKTFFRQVETYFLTNSSFRLVDTDFLSSGKSIFFQSFIVETFEIWRWQFLLVETDILASRNYFLPISQILPLVKAILYLVETYF